MHDAVVWKIIDEYPLCKAKAQKRSVKANEFVPRALVDKLMKKAIPVWQVILGLSRCGGTIDRALTRIPTTCGLLLVG
ncbi:MAG: hypothetical protein ACOYKN_11745 [Pirellula sp.]|jgi:hypothetical protein